MMQPRSPSVAAALLALAAIGATALPARADTRSDIQKFLQAELEQSPPPPSISVAVGVGDEVVMAMAVGYANIERKVVATPDTQYRAYSITKGITAIAVMQLLDHGDVSLDDDIQEYVPAFPRKQWPIHVEHLLAHTSGIRHYREGAGEISSRTEYPTLVDAIAIFKDDPLEFQPGTAYGYTSFGFNLLQGVIESAFGTSYDAYLQQAIFVPAGMTHTVLHTVDRSLPDLATPYEWGGWFRKKLRPLDDLPSASSRYAAGGVVSTPSDLVRLFIALDRGALLSDSTRALMYSRPYPDLNEGQAYGWNYGETDDGHPIIYRTGGGIGYTGYLIHFPIERVTGALLVNKAEFDRRLPVLTRVLEPYLETARQAGGGGP